MKHDEFKEMCRVAWSEKFNYICIDMTKNKIEGNYRFFNESKNTYIKGLPETTFLKTMPLVCVIKK